MDPVVQQNASGAEESASAAEELSAQAVLMRNSAGSLLALVEGRRDAEARSTAIAPKTTRTPPVDNFANGKKLRSARTHGQGDTLDFGGNGNDDLDFRDHTAADAKSTTIAAANVAARRNGLFST